MKTRTVAMAAWLANPVLTLYFYAFQFILQSKALRCFSLPNSLCVCVIQTNLRVTASYRVEAISGDTAASFSYHHHTRHITQKGNKTCNLDPFPYSLKYKIQVQLKFQILVTSRTFLYNVTICYLQVVLSHLKITM